ncbi:MAG TPA: amino acid adenylation domain-containing protein, partial [Candidatus Nanopelagicales bacterium]|nr:amino acid adenylation domain-containing protein [Candidatus Nanopelagicales bacterium]
DRIGMMLEDARVSVLITRERLVGMLPPTSAHTICLDAALDPVVEQSEAAPVRRAGPDNLAYVMYTSGSTGRPKGVMITHRGLVNYLSWAAQAYATSEGLSAPVHSSVGFDLTVTSLFSPLLAGKAVHMLSEEAALDRLLATLCDSADHTLVKLTPSHLEALHTMHGSSDARWHARVFVLGGEVLTARHAIALRARAPGARIINEYGPTETVVGCCTHEVVAPSGEGALPIGRPIANTQLHVLDGHLQQSPISVAGELYIGGDGVARGYLARPAATAASFVPDPFSGVPGARLYRSGDRARWREDGELEFLGRADDQVKVRGHRIELGEIEAALSAHPAVREAVVLAREDAPGDRRLVAYVVPERAGATAVESLRDHLQAKLPSYMVPSAIVLLESLPLSSNGKVDRRALPSPEATRSEAAGARVEPRDRTELELARIFEDLLQVRPVGARDDFFALGGHSLLAVRLVARIKDRFGRDLPLSQLFRGATVEGLASVLTGGALPASQSPLVTLNGSGSNPPFFCVHAVGGSALAFRTLALRLGGDQPFHALHASGIDTEDAPSTRIEEMAQRYIKAIQKVQPRGPYRLGGWSFGGLVAFEMARRLSEAGEEIAGLVLIDTTPPAPSEPPDERLLLLQLAWEVGIPLSPEMLVGSSIDEAISLATREAARHGLLPAGAGEAYIRRLLRVLGAHHEAARHHAPGPYEGPLALLWAAEQPGEPPPGDDPARGWGALATGPISVETVPGNHFTMIQDPHAGALAAALSRILAGRAP